MLGSELARSCDLFDLGRGLFIATWPFVLLGGRWPGIPLQNWPRLATGFKNLLLDLRSRPRRRATAGAAVISMVRRQYPFLPGSTGQSRDCPALHRSAPGVCQFTPGFRDCWNWAPRHLGAVLQTRAFGSWAVTQGGSSHPINKSPLHRRRRLQLWRCWALTLSYQLGSRDQAELGCLLCHLRWLQVYGADATSPVPGNA